MFDHGLQGVSSASSVLLGDGIQNNSGSGKSEIVLVPSCAFTPWSGNHQLTSIARLESAFLFTKF